MREIKTDLAVSGILMRGDQFLLLRRVDPPHRWCPPGGRVRAKEGFIEAVEREILEEANIKTRVLMPISAWHGSHDDVELYSIDFLCAYEGGEMKVSEEHSEGSWFSFPELAGLKMTHSLEVFKRALRVVRLFNELLD